MEIATTSLKENERIKELLAILDNNGLKQEKKQVIEMADYIDHMDKQFSQVLAELKIVKEQVGEIQDKGIRATVSRAVVKIEGKVLEAKRQISELKETFIENVKKSVSAFKLKGIQALSKVTEGIGIKNGLLTLGEQLDRLASATDKEIMHLEDIKVEAHATKFHLRNIGRELTGKEPLKLQKYEVEKGIIFQVQKSLYGSLGVVSSMERRTKRGLEGIERLEKRAKEGGRSSVRKNLQSIQAESVGVKEGGNKVKETVR